MRVAFVLPMAALSISTGAFANQVSKEPDRVKILEFIAAFESSNTEKVKDFLAGRVSYLDNYKTGRMEKISVDEGLDLLSGYHVYNINFRGGVDPMVIWSNGHELDKCFDVKSSAPAYQVQTALSVRDGKIGVIYALRDLNCPPVAASPVGSDQ